MKRRYLVLLVLAASALAVAAVVAVIYQVENVRGARAWAQARRELAAQGESLDPADFIPPSVPDDQNLAMIPLFARALDYRVDPQTNKLTFGPNPPTDTLFRGMPFGVEHNGSVPRSAFGGWETGHSLDMAGVQQFYAKQRGFPQPSRPGIPANDVLQALTKFAPMTDQLEAAIPLRPQSRFPVDWLHWPPSTLALPHDNLIQLANGMYRLRALAHLDAGQHAEAAHDLATAFRLRDAVRPEPTLIAHLIVITCDGLMLQPIWEGLAARRWTADELQAIQTQLRTDNLLADYVRALRSERALAMCRWLDGLRKSGNTRGLIDPTMDADATTRKSLERFAALVPAGWIDQNEASLCLAYQGLISCVVNFKARRVSPTQMKAQQQQRWATDIRFTPTAFLVKIVMPALESVLVRATQSQTACEQAEVACALERYFLEHQSYPEALTDLVPSFLDRVPTDLIDGAPMRYRRTDDSRYLLYGIGWNERDDDGTVAWPKYISDAESTRPERQEGDWVWQYQSLQPPAH